MPISFRVRITRMAISPRFATRTFSNMDGGVYSPLVAGLPLGRGSELPLSRPQLGPLAGPDHLVAAGADADEAHGDAGALGDELDVLARLAGQLGEAAAAADVALEAGQLLVLGDGAVQDRLVVGELLEHGALGAAVADGHPERLDAGEDVELGEGERRHPVEARRVAQGHQVQPAGPPRAPGRRAPLAAALAKERSEVVVELGREGPRPHARGVGLGDAPDLVYVGWPDARPHARRPRDRVRRGDEG